MRRALPALMLVAAMAAAPARADTLAAGLSTDAIQITSSFKGADVVLFGALATGSRLRVLADRDIVVAVRGPDVPVTVRRKARVAGIWVNAEAARLDGMPAYYYVASSRPLAEIAADAELAQRHISTAHLAARVSPAMAQADAEAFRAAVIRDRTRAKLYAENGAGIDRLGHYLFRVRIRLPASVPPGRYRADIYLFDKGKVVAHEATLLPIRTAGMERRLASYANDLPLLYGLATVTMALVLGWLGFAVLRSR